MNVVLARKPTQSAAPLPEKVRGDLVAARDRMSDLVRQQAEAAEASITSPEAEKRYFDICKQMAALDGDIGRLEAALVAMERRADEDLRADQIREQAALRQRVADVLDKRGAAAEAFSKAIGEAVRALHELASLSDRALMAWPGVQPAGGVALTNAELLQLAASEMYRLGHTVVLTGRPPSGKRPPPSLPPPKCPTLQQLDMPESITPLADAIAAANACGRDYLEGRR